MSRHLVLALLAASCFASHAQSRSANIRTFQPGSGMYYVFSEDAMIDDHKGLTLGLTYDYENDPLVRTDALHQRETGEIFTDLHSLDIQGKYRFNSRWEMGLGIPIHEIKPENDIAHTAVGDARLFAKWRMTPDDLSATGVALVVDARIPSGNEKFFLSDSSMAIGARLVLEHDFNVLKLAGNAGYMYADNSQVEGQELAYRRRVPLSASAWVPLGEKWAFNLEGAITLVMPVNEYQNPSDSYVGLQYMPSKNMTIFAGGGVGNFDGVGSNDYRLMAGLRASFDPSDNRQPPLRPEPPAPKPTPTPTPTPVSKPRVKFTDKAIIITEEVKFETDKDVLTKSGQNLLDEVAAVMKANVAYYKTITIEGHTDERGTDAYNMNLSNNRANSVKEYLVSRGVPETRLNTVGYGERRKKSVGHRGMSAERRYAIDRRVEFKVNKK